MACDEVLGSRLSALWDIVRDGLEDAPAHVQGFVTRSLDGLDHYPGSVPFYQGRSVEAYIDAVRFDGYPALAQAGYTLAGTDSTHIDANIIDAYLQCITHQRGRPAQRQAEIAADALALLGIADGLRTVSKIGSANVEQLATAKKWIRDLLDHHGGCDARLTRARYLASDLLDDQGRFGRRLLQSDDVWVAAVDLSLWRCWKDVLRSVEHPDTEQRRKLLKGLLTAHPPGDGEVLHAASWLSALDALIDKFAASAVPHEHQVVRMLAQTQGSFLRWRWEATSTRRSAMPTRWLIDKEADVQSFLLAVLYPHFMDLLQDEQYLQGFGLRQGRFDFAIPNIGLIIEVKVLRTSRDVNSIEAAINDDLALYFKDGNPFRTMIVYIYDDRDKPEPEKYPAIRDALKRRSNRIVDVVIVRRPSMIPNRDQRARCEEG